jgi:zinc transporter 2
MIHIIGDIIQSIGVIIAAILVYFFEYQLIDPLTTILFSVIVMFTTIPIIKQCFSVIMESSPCDLDVEEIKKEIQKVRNNNLIINLTLIGGRS